MPPAAMSSTSGPTASIDMIMRIMFSNCSLLLWRNWSSWCFSRERFDDADTGEGLLHRHDHLPHVLLFVLHCFPSFPAVNHDRRETDRKENECHKREFPIHVEQHRDAADDR